MDGTWVGTTSTRRPRTLRVLQLPLLKLLFQEVSDFPTGRRFSLHTFDPKTVPELLINVERDFLHAQAPSLYRIRERSVTHGRIEYQKTFNESERRGGEMPSMAFDSHQPDTQARVEEADGRKAWDAPIAHERGAWPHFLGACESGSPVAVEPIGH
jgi:hypothetical protein